MYRVIGLCAVLFLASCASNQPLVAVGVACDTYASSLKVVAGMNDRGKLRPSHVKVVDSVVASVGPICRDIGPETLVLPNVLDKVEEGIKGLLEVRNAT